MDKKAFTLILSFLLILSLVVTEFAIRARANPLPDIEPAIIIRNPQNTTYNSNNIVLNFTASSTWISNSIFYSFDGLYKVAINNSKLFYKKTQKLAKNPSIYRTTVEGSCVYQMFLKVGIMQSYTWLLIKNLAITKPILKEMLFLQRVLTSF